MRAALALVACGAIFMATSATARDGTDLRALNAGTDARVDPSGAVDSGPGLKALLGAGGVSLKLPCGTYLVGRPLALPSHAELYAADKT